LDGLHQWREYTRTSPSLQVEARKSGMTSPSVLSPKPILVCRKALSKVCGKKYKTIFSHGEIGPHNIIWRDGKIVIIDWARAG
jgi:thiamine kinase-like enzyme